MVNSKEAARTWLERCAARAMAAATLLGFALGGCGQAKPVQPYSPTTTAAGRTDQEEAAGGQSELGDVVEAPDDEAPASEPIDVTAIVPKGPVMRATYQISVTAMGMPMPLCIGEIEMIINGDMTMSIPSATMQCGAGMCTVNVAAMIASMKSDLVNPKGLLATVHEAGGILRVAQVSGGSFNPPRPMLLAALAKKAKDLAGVNDTYSGTMVNAKTGEHASGTIATRVLSANADTVSWEMRADGWDGIDRAKYAILKRLSMTWKLHPISVPQMVVTTPVMDLLKASGMRADAGPAELVKMCAGNGQILSTVVGIAEEIPIIGAISNVVTTIAKSSDATATITLKNQTMLGGAP